MKKKPLKNSKFSRRQAISLLASGLTPSIGNTQPVSDTVYDVAIVGAGPAGLSLCDKLTRHGIKVALVESGGMSTPQEFHYALNMVTDGNGGLPYPLETSSTRMFGGTTSIWGGHCPRMTELDLSPRTKFGYGNDWPIGYEELEAHYCEAEKWLSVYNQTHSCYTPKIVRRSAGSLSGFLNEHGFSHIKLADVCASENGIYTPKRLRESHAKSTFTNPLINVFLNTTVRRFVYNKNDSIKSLLCTNKRGETIEVKTNLTVLCAGALQNTRILLLNERHHGSARSGNSSGKLGKNFHEHPSVGHDIYFKSHVTQLRGYSQSHDWGIYREQKSKGLPGQLRLWSTDLRHHDSNRNPTQIKVDTLFEQAPSQDRYIALDNTISDPLGDAVLSYHQKGPWMEGLNLKKIKLKLENKISRFSNIDEVITSHIREGSHHIYGTTPMSSTDRDGVVDTNLKVFGTKNLYVASSSVFPAAGASNPTLTMVALALRLAEHIKTTVTSISK